MTRRRCLKGRPATCGGYTVAIAGGRIRVRCQVCGPTAALSPNGARRLAAALAGPLGRFQTPAPRAERYRLAGLLRAAARAVEGRS